MSKKTINNYIAHIAGPDLKHIDGHVLVSDGYYIKHKIKKRSGGLREIIAPQPPLINVQDYILHNFLYKFKCHEAAHGFVLGRSPKTAADQHLGAKVLLTADIKDFFPNIRIPRVLKLFKYLISRDLYKQKAEIGLVNGKYDFFKDITIPDYSGLTLDNKHVIAFALAKLCCENGKLPQGAPTSPAIANLIAYGLDKSIQAYCDAKGFTYTRYADDIAISCTNDKVYFNIDEVKGLIRESGFLVNKKKIKVKRQHQRMSVVGVVINEKLSVPRWKWRNFKAKLHNYQRDNKVITKKEHQRLRGYCEWIMSLHPKRGQKLLKMLGKITVKKTC